jgi:hypothetical protein
MAKKGYGMKAGGTISAGKARQSDRDVERAPKRAVSRASRRGAR